MRIAVLLKSLEYDKILYMEMALIVPWYIYFKLEMSYGVYVRLYVFKDLSGLHSSHSQANKFEGN